MLFLEIEESENEKETEPGKNKEKRLKKPKKKDQVKDAEDQQKTKKSTKKDRKRNFHFQHNEAANCCLYPVNTHQRWLPSDVCREKPGGFHPQNRVRF